jgi:UDP-N-acetylmuramyl pentapeptide phosphotransferase/UDP-N-acetylglucosamine-1-phosphate transferase
MSNTSLFNALIVLAAAFMAFMAVRWVYFKILKIAKDKNLVDNPNARKLQKMPVPVMGGTAVFLGVVVGVLTGAALSIGFGMGSMAVLLPIILAMMVMLYIGAMDDIIGLSPRSRFFIETITIMGLVFASGNCVDSLHGLWGVGDISWWIAVPLTVVGGVGIVNAVNMIDGVNGLSSGLCISCCLIYGIVFSFAGDLANALLAFTMATALLPFLFHNVFGMRSKMFIGDAGTMVMGILLAWFTTSVLCRDSALASVCHQQYPNTNLVAMALAILSVPVFDTVRVMMVRILRHKNPFRPDKTHLHHVFINIGVSHAVTSLIEIGINLLIVVLWALSARLNVSMDWQLYIVIAISILLVWGTYFFLRNQVRHHTRFMHRLAHFSIVTHLGNKNWWMKFQMLLDRREIKEVKNSKQQKNKASFHIEFDPDPSNYKEQDRRRVLEFMKGKAEVYVVDIKKHSNAEQLRVDTILSEGELEGYIKVITCSSNGVPLIVALDEDVTF